jgi:hypothetical protein
MKRRWPCRASRVQKIGCVYRIEIVTPVCVLTPPMRTCTGTVPGDTVAGIVTLSCNTPETHPGASPKKATVAGWPLINTVTRDNGIGVTGGEGETV